MFDGTDSDSPIDRVAAVAGDRATAAFNLLGNQTRLAILLALFEAYVPNEPDDAVPFADLRDRVGAAEDRQFGYHLAKLEGQFVAQGEDGYQLTSAGLTLVQTVIAGTAIEQPSMGPAELEETCPVCGAPVVLTYGNESAVVSCSSCDGLFSHSTREGVLVAFRFPPAGLADRSPSEVLHAAFEHQLNRAQTMVEGVCDRCGGTVATELEVCEDHDASDGPCDHCGTGFVGLAKWRCRTCKNSLRGPSWARVQSHPAVIAFYHEHGIELSHSSWDGFQRGFGLDEELVSTDPARLRITAQVEDDQLVVELDDDLRVRPVDD